MPERQALSGVIDALHRLPSPRGVALELLRLSRDENAGVREVVRLAQADPVLAGRLIRAANSAASGAAPRTGSIAAAVMRLGFTATRQIALAFSLVSDFRRGACRRFDYTAFWSGSLLRGLAARAVAARLRAADPNEALVGGLLAEIGRLALASAQPDAYGELLALHGQRGARLRAAEWQQFAIDHGVLGGALLGRWTLPPALVRSVSAYFEPAVAEMGPDRPVRRMALTLVLAESIAQALSGPVGGRNAWTHLAIESAARLDAQAGALDEVAEEIAAEALSWAPLLELPVPAIDAPDFPGYVHGSGTGPPEQAGLRTLVVQDNPSDRLRMKLALEGAGHEVRLATDGQEALAAIAAATPQLVVTDFDLPRMGGLELCRRLRQSRLGACLHLIVLADRESHEDLVECIDAGANDFVSKSAPREVLLARVSAAARAVRCSVALQNEFGAARELVTAMAIDRRRRELESRRN